MGLFLEASGTCCTHHRINGCVWQFTVRRQSLGHDVLDSQCLGAGLVGLPHERHAHSHLCWRFVFSHINFRLIGLERDHGCAADLVLGSVHGHTLASR